MSESRSSADSPSKAVKTQASIGMGKPSESAHQPAGSEDFAKDSQAQSLSTTPTQSQLTATMHTSKEASQSTLGVGQGSGSSMSSRSNMNPSQSTPRLASRSMSITTSRDAGLYNPSEIDTASGISASEYSSGEEDVDGSRQSKRASTIRGRPTLGDRNTLVSQSSNVSRSAQGNTTLASSAGVAKGSRRPSVQARGLTNQSERERSKARRGSARGRDDDDEDEDDGGRFGPLDDEDDEVQPQDRGEELVRRRMKARAKEKAARRKAEKEKEKQQQQMARLQAGGPPLSPRAQTFNRQSMVSSPAALDREGRPTFIAMPGADTLNASQPATLSPLLPVSPGVAKTGYHYPSPHSHIRRPSGRTGDTSQSASGLNRRVSALSGGGYSSTVGQSTRTPIAGTHTPQLGHGPDVFSEHSLSERGMTSSTRDVSAVHDEQDEERDTVAGLATDVEQRGEVTATDIDVDHETAPDEGEMTVEDQEQGEDGEEDAASSGSHSGDVASDEDVEYTLKDRQDAINIEHPFGLPIWKPALYKKSRTVTRNAESALHSIPSAAAERHLLPGNLLWTIFAGSWLSLVCFLGAIIINLIPLGGAKYARVAWELGGYLFWPFGKYVEVEVGPESGDRDHAAPSGYDADMVVEEIQDEASTTVAVPGNAPSVTHNSDSLELSRNDTIRPGDTISAYKNIRDQQASSSSSSEGRLPTPDDQSGDQHFKGKSRSYGAIDNLEDGKTPLSPSQRMEEEADIYGYVHDEDGKDIGRGGRLLGTFVYGVLFWLVLAPLMGIVCLACWGLVFPIPMAKLTWVLIRNLATRPLALHFRSAPGIKCNADTEDSTSALLKKKNANSFLRTLKPGQFAPRSTQPSHNGRLYRRSKILLCTYRGLGAQYYKYTVGGVNILFVNTLPFVFFTIFDFFFVEPYVHKHHIKEGFLTTISSQGAMFVFALGSVIPLSYFIGMAVASISAQSSIGMGAVINATFGSMIEIILYGIALTQQKARLVEGSIVGSILAGVLLMPGISMCSGATRRKEQRFNARSAGVTSTMLIMAIIGILTPTLFYQIYGTFQLTCNGCPTDTVPGRDSWTCKGCYYEHVPPATDPFYQDNVKGLMYTCTVILVLSYAVGLWFSLRTHASQIWQNAPPSNPAAAQNQAAPHAGAAGAATATMHNAPVHPTMGPHRASVYKRMLPANVMQQLLPSAHSRPHSQTVRSHKSSSGTLDRDSVAGAGALQLPEGVSQEEYERAIALSASTFHHAIRQQQQSHGSVPHHYRDPIGSQNTTLARNSTVPQDSVRYQSVHEGERKVGATGQPLNNSSNAAFAADDAAAAAGDGGGHGGHDAPSWTRATSLIVLLSCTVLYAIIAEILVDAVDVVLDGSGLDIKLLGVTLFALVPNATEFMNAMSFAINGNIALSMEIGSAYALQVCLIQIPAMVGFSAWYNANRIAEVHSSFTLIFPRWDVIAIIFAIFLLTYTYIEARSNYFRGSLLILSYIVLVSGFVFAPSTGDTENPGDDNEDENTLLSMIWQVQRGAFGASPVATGQSAITTSFGGLRESMSSHPAIVGLTWLQAVLASVWYR